MFNSKKWSKKYYKLNKEKIKNNVKKWQEKNKIKVKKYKNKYAKNNNSMKTIKFENWHKYNKEIWLSDMRAALIDIETNNGENVFDLLEDYYECELETGEISKS